LGFWRQVFSCHICIRLSSDLLASVSNLTKLVFNFAANAELASELAAAGRDDRWMPRSVALLREKQKSRQNFSRKGAKAQRRED
jgi:hypothetical protein